MHIAFTSKDQEFISRRSSNRTKLVLVLPICIFLLVAIFMALGSGLKIRHHGKAGILIDALSNMSSRMLFVAIMISAAVTFLVYYMVKTKYEHRKIVTGLNFDDAVRKLSVTTKTVHGVQESKTYQYGLLSLKNIRYSDGMTQPMYNTIALMQGDEQLGLVYKGHFTWSADEVEQIEKKLRDSVQKTF